MNINPNQMSRATNVNLSNTVALNCESCQHNVFVTAYIFRKASRLLTGETKDQIITIPVFVCAKCGNLNKELLPEEVKSLI